MISGVAIAAPYEVPEQMTTNRQVTHRHALLPESRLLVSDPRPKTQQLIENPINRYLLNSEMLPNMKKNSDGSLTLIIQKDSPGKAKEANWLPAPNGPIYMLLRLYIPTETPPSILPIGEGSWKPPAVMQAQLRPAKSDYRSSFRKHRRSQPADATPSDMNSFSKVVFMAQGRRERLFH
jgi:Protein of unknown function (DUF1214)